MNPLRDEPNPKDVATVKRWGCLGLIAVAIKANLRRKRVEVKNTPMRKIDPRHTQVGYIRDYPSKLGLCNDDDEEDTSR